MIPDDQLDDGPDPGVRVLYGAHDPPPLRPDVAADLTAYRAWQSQHQHQRPARRGRPARRRRSGPEGGTGDRAGPALALLMVVDGPDPGQFRQGLRSLVEQSLRAWELSVVTVGSATREVADLLAETVGRSPGDRVKVAARPPGTDHAEAAAVALEQSAAPVLALLGPGDRLAPDALALLCEAMQEADVAYGDEDRVDRDGAAVDPSLKPDWSPDLLLSCPYLGRPLALRRSVVEAAGGIRPLPGGDWEHDLMLRVTERAGRVRHVPEVLCHRPAVVGHGQGPTEGPAAVVDALARRHDEAAVAPGPLPRTWTVRRRPAGGSTVSIIVPFRDGAGFLRACADSVLVDRDGLRSELVLVDNGSVEPETLTLVDRLAEREDVVVVSDDRPFNWAALNNGAVDITRGEVLLFLNNDVEARRAGWLEALVAQVLRPDVGVAGARLLYPSGRVQHAGMVVGLGGAAGHVPGAIPGDQPGYLGMAVLARDCSAVTGACLATSRQLFDQLGGFDESLGLDLNDVDYCLRARQAGLRVVFEPMAELLHYESPSRGTSGSREDILRFVHRWRDQLEAGDPFLNPHLTRKDGSCALADPGEEEGWREWLLMLETTSGPA